MDLVCFSGEAIGSVYRQIAGFQHLERQTHGIRKTGMPMRIGFVWSKKDHLEFKAVGGNDVFIVGIPSNVDCLVIVAISDVSFGQGDLRDVLLRIKT